MSRLLLVTQRFQFRTPIKMTDSRYICDGNFLVQWPLLIACALASFASSAQTEGNQVFGVDQILQVDVVFASNNFWNELEVEYDGDQNYVEADVTISGVNGTQTLGQVGIRLKGNSSMFHPGNKKSFKIDFNEFVPGQAFDGLKKLNFSNGFKDPTFIREKIFFDVCQEAGILSPRANFAEVTFNGEPWGFYTIIEQIDDQFLDRSIGDDGGNLFKAGSNFGGGDGEASLEYLGADQSSYTSSYDLKNNEVEDDWTDLIDFVDFINNTSDAVFEEELGDWLDLTAYLRSAALDNLFANLDTYTLSARNYYIYHNSTTGHWQWIKWDANEVFGSYAMGVGGSMITLDLDFDGGNENRPLLQRILQSETLKNAYYAEMCDLRTQWFNPEYMEPRMDVLKALIEEAVLADGNKMYSNNQFQSNFNVDQGGMGGSLYGLKPFVEGRTDYLDLQLDCTSFSRVLNATLDAPIVFPNPASHEVTIASIVSQPDLRVVDAMGREVCILPRSQTVVLDVSSWPNGLFWVQSIQHGAHGVVPFMVQH